MEIISRKDAHAKGLKHFYTGRPCKRDHLRERSVSTGACLGCLAVYAREQADKFKRQEQAARIGETDHKMTINPADVDAIEAFAALLRSARIKGTPAPLVPREADVAAVNTMISMMAPSPPPAPLPLAVVDTRHAMWVRIHGQEIADQMLEQASR